VDAFREREAGRSRTGSVDLRSFDLGVVLTLGGKVHVVDGVSGYGVSVPGVDPPPGFPAVPITFGDADDAFVNYLLPSIVVVREDVAPAMFRWHPGKEQYRVPAVGSEFRTITGPGGQVKEGYTAYEAMPQAVPYDLSYSIHALHQRRGLRARQSGQALLMYLLHVCQPYFTVFVTDTIGDRRIYFATAESLGSRDEVIDVADRTIGGTLSVTVEAELDLNDPHVLTSVTSRQVRVAPIHRFPRRF